MPLETIFPLLVSFYKKQCTAILTGPHSPFCMSAIQNLSSSAWNLLNSYRFSRDHSENDYTSPGNNHVIRQRTVLFLYIVLPIYLGVPLYTNMGAEAKRSLQLVQGYNFVDSQGHYFNCLNPKTVLNFFPISASHEFTDLPGTFPMQTVPICEHFLAWLHRNHWIPH